MASILLEHISKHFDDVVAVDDLTLNVQDQELLVLLGPTGAGKTTTLRCIAGLDTPESGHIYIGGQCVDQWTPSERDVAFVFQSHVLYPHLTVFDNIAFPLHPRKLPAPEIRDKVVSVAATLHIEHLLNRKPAQLSGGEIQRVGLGRAMVRDPQVYLMDEPLTNLDAKLRAEMRGELKWRHREMGVTTFYVTHDQIEAMTMGDRIAVLNQGKLQQLAPPMTVYDQPTNLFVAGLIGNPTMNLLDASLHVQAEQCVVRLVHTGIEVVLSQPQKRLIEGIPEQSDWVFGVRAEDVQVTTSGKSNTDVYAVEPLGAETYLDLSLGQDPQTGKDVVIKARTGAFERWAQGEAAALEFLEDRIHLFRGDTGEAIF